MFDAVEETLDEVALAIEPRREGERALAVCLGWDVSPGLSLPCLGADGVAVVALVGQKNVALAESVDQGFGLPAVGNLPSRQAQGYGAAVLSR